MSSRTYYPGITIFKLAGALAVLFAHSLFIPSMTEMTSSPLVNYLLLQMRIIVPCFYAAAGFLAYKSWSHAEDSKAYVRRYVTRIGWIYGMFCLLFFFKFNIPALFSGGLGLHNLFLQFKIIVMAVLVNGPFVQLWFIPPLLFGVVLSYALLSRSSARLWIILAAAGYCLSQLTAGTLRGAYDDVMNGVAFFHTTAYQYAELAFTRYMGFGLAFVLAGALIAKYEQLFLRLAIRRALLMSGAATCVETLLLLGFSNWTNDYKLTVSLLPNTLLLFYGVLVVRNDAVRRYHSVLSLFCLVSYCGHIVFMEVNNLLFGWQYIGMPLGVYLLQSFLTLIECVGLTILLARRSRKRWRASAGHVQDAAVVQKSG
ncbi:acyltransferase family protein [Paenibacillus sp. HB172176]|uniref:acyltransferase family protein n=1 Tax=Paenibacillus sp. HB172176 TaxID=2493690 RepID=UPI00143C5507|nr:acyltransferase family protein [Paenibacillus sp. HB172176]